MTVWFTETLYEELGQRLRIDEVLYRGKTSYQRVEIFSNARLGRVLCLDGVVQTAEADEFHYHEMLTHPALFGHGAARRVLIIGGADGGALREVLRHPIERVVEVDIDAELIELCREHLPSLSVGAYDDPRTVLAPGDGAQYVAETDERFDVVIVDSTDPVGPGAVLFETPFFSGCRRVLKDGGVVVNQNGVPFFQAEELRGSHGRRRALFRHAGFYVSPVPTYYGGQLAFGWGSDGLDLAAVPQDAVAARAAAAGFETRRYNPAFHAAAFALPNDLAWLRAAS